LKFNSIKDGVYLIFSDDELKRYDRQMMIDGWGIKGQEKLKASKVTIVGVGGLGCPVSIYLAAAGVGKLVLIDSGRFELSNLNRQILGWTDDVGRLKVESAKEKLRALNPGIDIIAVNKFIEEENVDELISKSNVVVDALDNWGTRFFLIVHASSRGCP